MTTLAESTSGWRKLRVFLREELGPRPGRGAAVARIAASCAVTVAIAMVFQIPLPAYMTYVVLLLSRDEAVSTLVTAVGGAVAVTLAVVLSLLLYMLDAAEPALRLPLMAASTFLGMFLTRTSTLGPVAFIAAFVLVLSQTLVDDVPSLEMLTRLVLWLWVVALVPATLTALVNLLLGENPAKLARQRALRLLDIVAATLEGRHLSALIDQQAEALGLLELQRRAMTADRHWRERADVDHRLIETLIELLTLLRALRSHIPREIRELLADAANECRRALASERAPTPTRRTVPEASLSGLTADVLPIVTAIGGALGRLGNDIASRRAAATAPSAPTKPSLFVPDAWSNPEHVRFALKATIAVMAAYMIYSALDWPGIRTAVTTCFFVALGSLGETMHKLTLRISGALIGGLAAGLCIVYLLPHMTDIGQLCLLIAAASGISAWVATSSERLSYMGLQMAFAFFLGVLQGYAPATDLTVLRDRMIGILLGNLLMSIVFSVIWPISALDRARTVIAQAMGGLAELMRDAINPKPDARLAAVQRLTEARHFTSVAVFEMNLVRTRSQRASFEETAVLALDRLASAVFVVAGQSSSEDIGETGRKQDAASSAWFAETARRITAGQPAPAPPGKGVPAEAQAVLPLATAPSLRAAIEARALLQREIERVVASTPA